MVPKDPGKPPALQEVKGPRQLPNGTCLTIMRPGVGSIKIRGALVTLSRLPAQPLFGQITNIK